MALSPNYGWSEPDNSSLVKNGAADIRTLGDAIDTSVWNVGFGQAGKNKFINGDFAINQRAFSSTTTSGVYTFDRWLTSAVDGTSTFTAQTFTTGSAPVAGYEGKNFIQIVSSGQTLASAQTSIGQRIEGVRTFAGQPVTISFWAKANTGTPKVAVEVGQNFGAGGSPSAFNPIYFGQVTLSTSWARYSVTATVTSLSGKTIGTDSSDSLNVKFYTSAGSDLNARTGSLGIQSFTCQMWGVQMEYGSKATPFQTATGTIQGELAACQRYYYRFASEGKTYASFNIGGYFESSIKYIGRHQHPVAMRTNPTTLDYANLSIIDTSGTFYAVSAAAIDTNTNTTLGTMINFTVSGATTSRFGSVLINNNTGAYLGIGAEL